MPPNKNPSDILDLADATDAAGLSIALGDRRAHAVIVDAVRLGGLGGRLGRGPVATTTTRAELADWVRRGCPLRMVKS